MQLLDTPLSALATEIRSGARSATATARQFLERIERLEPQLNAFITVDAAGALAAAARVDDAVADGSAVGPLCGVPLALKDILVTDGLQTTCGSQVLRGWCPPFEATVVQRLRAAGAVILGKTNMDEFAMGSSTEHSSFGACHNPWSLAHVPGGSSGGSAAAVAAGLCAAALGTDTGGSIRQPAAYCGVVGLKPTYGRVSRYGVVAFASSLDQVGPLGRSVRDCAALLEVIAGCDPLDATSLPQPVGAYCAACEKDPRGLRVGVPAEYFGDTTPGRGLHPAVRQATAQALQTLRELGLQTVSISLPHTRYAIPAYYLICMAEASSNLARFDGVRYGLRAAGASELHAMYARSRAQGFGPEVRRRIILGTFALSAGYYDAYYGKAQRVRTLIQRDFEQAWSRCDVIATPTAPAPAFAIGELVDDPLQMYLGDVFTTSINLAGLPGLSLPSGFDPESGLPLGLQLVGPPLAEEQLLRVAAAFEQAAGFAGRHPPLAQCEVRS